LSHEHVVARLYARCDAPSHALKLPRAAPLSVPLPDTTRRFFVHNMTM